MLVLSKFKCGELLYETLTVIERIPCGEKQSANTHLKMVCSRIPIGQNLMEFRF